MKVWRLVLAITLLLACLALFFYARQGLTHNTNKPTAPTVAGEYTVYFVNVGQGDGILVDYGTNEMVIDGGSSDSGFLDNIAPYVDGHIERVILTHDHEDHYGGLLALTTRYTVDSWYGHSDKLPRATSLPVGTTITLGDLQFRLLNTYTGKDTVNNDSMVLRLDTAGASFLFMGDADFDVEERLQTGHVDILKVGHHGSCTSTSPAFVSMVTPEVAIYSAGIGNKYGHPCADTLARLADSRVYGTDVNGTISVHVTNTGYVVQPQRP